jgi:hypothetical protein
MPEIPGSASRGNAPSRNDAQEPGCPQAVRCRVPHGTPQFTRFTRLTRLTRFLRPASLLPRHATRQNIHGSVLVAVEFQPTARTDMRPHAERLPDAGWARRPIRQDAATVLAGVGWRRRLHRHTMQLAIVVHPAPQARPTHIGDGLRQAPVAHQVPHLQVFQGNQVV